MRIRPLRNRVLVKPIRRTMSEGGIHLPEDYNALPSWKAVNKDDDFRAEVIAVGPEVNDAAVYPGALVQILTWSDGTELDGKRRSMYTGVDGPDGTLFVKYPEDFAGYGVVQPGSGEHAAE